MALFLRILSVFLRLLHTGRTHLHDNAKYGYRKEYDPARMPQRAPGKFFAQEAHQHIPHSAQYRNDPRPLPADVPPVRNYVCDNGSHRDDQKQHPCGVPLFRGKADHQKGHRDQQRYQAMTEPATEFFLFILSCWIAFYLSHISIPRCYSAVPLISITSHASMYGMETAVPSSASSVYRLPACAQTITVCPSKTGSSSTLKR